MRKRHPGKIEKGLLTWLGDLIRPGWDVLLSLSMIEKLWNTFKEKYVSRDDFVEYLKRRRMTLDQWNQLRNDFENELYIARGRVEDIIELYKNGEFTREEMRREIEDRIRHFFYLHGRTLELIQDAIDWFKERDRMQSNR